MPYICQARADIPDGILQVLDLLPNTSQRNLIYDPPGQTKYVNRLQNDTVAISGTVTSAAYSGLAAYLLDAVADGGDDGALTSAQAISMAAAIIVRLDAGSALNLAGINTALQTVQGATELGGGATASVGTVAAVLKICAGGEYIVPAGTAADPGAAAFKATLAGAFTAGQYRATYDGFALAASFGEGYLSKMILASFEYGGAMARGVSVYGDDGAVYA